MLITSLRLVLLTFCLLTAAVSHVSAETRPLLHALFQDHAVLQRDRPVIVWGWAEAGTLVKVRFADQHRQAHAGPNGRWTVTLDPLGASSEGRTLAVDTDVPGLRTEANDLLVGDVWLCSGQSNMEMGITLCREDEEIAAADLPGLRLLTVAHQPAFQPQEMFAGTWMPCNPEALREGGWGGFSATAYFFGKHLHRELGIPIGLIHSSWGGTQAEAWTSAPALQEFPEFQPRLREVAAIAASPAEDPELAYLDAWFEQHDPGTNAGWHQPGTDISTWRAVSFPGNYAHCGIPGFEGVVWARREVELPAAWAGKSVVVRVGEISDNDTTWLNGKVIGRTNNFRTSRRYKVRPGIARPGTNTITLRITNAGGGGVFAKEHPLCIHPAGNPAAAVSLAGDWRLQETARKDDTGRPLVGNPRVPSVLYNGMIAPLVPAAMTGVIWYQGEANAGRAYQYRSLLPALIHDWRQRFERDDLAFHIVSLASYQKRVDHPRDNAWAELREAQAMTAKNVPHCGLAVAIDIGDAHDIHPRNKRDVGTRLARSALSTTYGKDVAGSGPWFRSAEAHDGGMRLHFDHLHGGLRFKGPADRSFAVAGKDRKFVWAHAGLDGETVVVSSPAVPDPVAVRYAWDANPQACLYNAAGLPAVPFRTDDWSGMTHGR